MRLQCPPTCLRILMLLNLAIAAPVIAATQQAVRSAPPTSEQPLRRILFGSCIKQDQPIPILQTILARQPDAFLFLGDNIYGDTEDMSVLSAKYQKLADDHGFQTLQNSCRILATWDDHDFGVNDGGADYRMRQQSEQVFLDFWKVPASSELRSRPGIHDAQIFGPEGQRVQVILLDTRYFRSPLKQGPRRVGGPYVPDSDPSRTMLGEAQWKWLQKQLLLPAELRIICTSIQCIAQDAGQETWSNLPHERKKLFQLIADTRAAGVIFISGDRHWAELSSITKDVPYPLHDLTSSSLNQLHGRGTPTDNRFRSDPNTYHRENYGEIRIDWEAPTPEVALEIHDLGGTVQLRKVIRLDELQPE